MPKQTSVQLTEATLRQVEELKSAGHESLTNIVRTAIDRMYHQEIKTMTSNTITIPQKMSGTGTIHDLASQHFDRKIDFGEDGEYAIVLASYYGDGNMYYIADTPYEAASLSREKQEYSHAILDRKGNHMDRDIFCREYDTLAEK